MNNIEYLHKLADGAVNFEWGSSAQIGCENDFYSIAFELLGEDPEDHPYILKATVPEAIDYVFDLLGITPRKYEQ